MSARELDRTAGDRVVATTAPARRRGRLVALGLLAAALLGGAAWTWHWWTHPQLFAESGAGMVARRDLDRVRPLHLGMTHSTADTAPRTVQVTAAEPVVLRNSAAAAIELHICTPGPRGPIGAVYGRLDRYCSEVRDAVGEAMALRGADSDYVVMTVTPTRRGVVEVDGLRLSYTTGGDGWSRRGTDHVGDELRLVVR